MTDLCDRHKRVRCDECREIAALTARLAEAEDALAVAEATCGQWMQSYFSITAKELEMDNERMMKWFDFEHLPEHLKIVSIKFFEVACSLCALVEPGPERTVALRKLLEAKDAAVRAKLSPGG